MNLDVSCLSSKEGTEDSCFTKSVKGPVPSWPRGSLDDFRALRDSLKVHLNAQVRSAVDAGRLRCYLVRAYNRVFHTSVA